MQNNLPDKGEIRTLEFGLARHICANNSVPKLDDVMLLVEVMASRVSMFDSFEFSVNDKSQS